MLFAYAIAYILVLIFPPLSVLLCAKPWQALANLVIWTIGIVTGVLFGCGIVLVFVAMLHAFLIVLYDQMDDRQRAAP